MPTLAIIGTPLTLTATIVPSNATNKTITWTVANAGTTGATITDNTLNTTGIGTVTVKVTIANGQAIDIPYTKDFAIIIRQNVEFIIDNFSDAIGSEIVPGTLRYALTNVQDGDTIRFSGVTPGVTEIALNSRLPIIENNIVIEGNGVILTRDISWTTIVSNDEGFMYIRRGSNITISRIHFKDSRTMFGGAIYNSGGNLTLESCIFSNNRSEHENPDVLFGGGGAITNFGGTLNVKGCTFYGNNAYNYGGAIASENINASMTFIGNLFYGNTAAGAPSAVSRYSGNPITSGGYNVVDVMLKTESTMNQYEWAAVASDRYSTINPFSNISTFEPVSSLRTIILTAPVGFPTTDFYGNVRTYPGAPGAVK